MTSGADVNDQEHGISALHVGALKGNLAIVKLLCKSEEIDINIKSKQNAVTPLFLAAEEGHFDVVSFLLEEGADVNFVNNSFITPLHIAAVKGHYAIVELLLQKGGKIASLFKVIKSLEVKGSYNIIALFATYSNKNEQQIFLNHCMNYLKVIILGPLNQY